MEKEKESLRLELNKAKQQIKEADSAINSQRAEIEKLNHIINEVRGPACDHIEEQIQNVLFNL